FFASRRRHTRFARDWSSAVCSADLPPAEAAETEAKAALEKARAVTAEASQREKESRDAARAAQSVLEQRRREHAQLAQKATVQRSEERRVGKERRTREARKGSRDEK